MNVKKISIYNYNKNGEFINKSDAQIIHDESIVPAFATTNAPPALKKNQTAVFDEKTQKWTLIKDNRGKRYFDSKREYVIETLHFSLPSNATFTPPPSQFHTLKNRMWIRDDNAFKKHLENELMNLVDAKQLQAEQMILGYKATAKQIERYRDKYERAKSGEFKAQENKIIITKYEAMLAAIRQFVDLIEAFRSAVDDLLSANQLDKAEQAINAGQTFDASTNPAQIKQLFKQLGTK